MIKSVNQNKKLILTAVFIFTLAVSFGFGNIEKASAGYCAYMVFNSAEGSTALQGDGKETASGECQDKNNCPASAFEKRCLYSDIDTPEIRKQFWNQLENEIKQTTGLQTNATGQITNSDTVCKNVSFNPLTWFNCLMLIILQFLALLLEAIAFLFVKVVDPKVFQAVVGANAEIYKAWAMVRDTLNIAFILVLLFSAFCTVFQIEKYNYKKILITLIIMALLVNFSFPIARVIIDFSNVIMYYFINNLGIGADASKIFPKIADNSAIATIIKGGDAGTSASSTMLLASVIFMFILVVTVFVITILLLIRIVVLAFLIIFSSIAFVGSIVPFLSSHASKWWDNIFKYSFFGPIMMFMIYISLQMMGSIRAIGGDTRSTIESMAFFSLPIVILLAGLMVAKNMSIMGASAVTGMAEKFLKSAGRQTYKLPWAGVKATGVPGGVQQKYKSIADSWKSKRETREAKVAAKLRVKGAEEKDMKRRAEEHKKNFTTDEELKSLAAKGDAAAAYRLAEDKKMDQETYDQFVAMSKNNSLKKAINSKVQQNRADLVTTNKISTMTAADISQEQSKAIAKGVPGAAGWTPHQVRNYVAEQELGNLNAERWAEQDWVKTTDGLIDPATGAINPEKERMVRAAAWSFAHMAPAARNEIRKRMSASNRAALTNAAARIIPPVAMPL